MHVEWDDALDAWVSDAETAHTGTNEAEGPAGPAGVCVLRRGGASLSQCTMTGRVASLWFEEHPTDEERALIELVLEPGADRVLASPRGPAFDLAPTPAGHRIDAARLAILTDTTANVPLPPGGVAEFLLHVELAAVLTRLHATNPAFATAADVQEACAHADRLATALAPQTRGGALTTLLPRGVRFDPGPASALLQGLAEDLSVSKAEATAMIRLLLDTSHHLDRQPRFSGQPADAAASHEALPAFRGRGAEGAAQAGSFPELFATPPLDVIVNSGEIQPGRVALRARIASDGSFRLGELAPNQIGFRDEGAHERYERHWSTVTAMMHPSARHPEHRWARGLRAGRPVGSGPFSVRGDEAVARFPVSAEPDEVIIGGHPLVRASTSRSLADLASVDRLSRAAWWKHRLDPGTASTWFAHSAVAWLGMGRVFRAGWAWSLADAEVGEELLARQADGDDLEAAVATLEAVSASGDLPGDELTSTIPVPAWVHAVDLADYAQFGRAGT